MESANWRLGSGKWELGKGRADEAGEATLDMETKQKAPVAMNGMQVHVRTMYTYNVYVQCNAGVDARDGW